MCRGEAFPKISKSNFPSSLLILHHLPREKYIATLSYDLGVKRTGWKTLLGRTKQIHLHLHHLTRDFHHLLSLWTFEIFDLPASAQKLLNKPRSWVPDGFPAFAGSAGKYLQSHRSYIFTWNKDEKLSYHQVALFREIKEGKLTVIQNVKKWKLPNTGAVKVSDPQVYVESPEHILTTSPLLTHFPSPKL